MKQIKCLAPNQKRLQGSVLGGYLRGSHRKKVECKTFQLLEEQTESFQFPTGCHKLACLPQRMLSRDRGDQTSIIPHKLWEGKDRKEKYNFCPQG